MLKAARKVLDQAGLSIEDIAVLSAPGECAHHRQRSPIGSAFHATKMFVNLDRR